VIDEVTFLRKIQRILEEGDFVATYKFALLQSLADLSVEEEPEPDGTLTLSLGQIAEKFVEYYWRQARPYQGDSVLKQNTGQQAAIINRVSEMQGRYEVSLTAARHDASGWDTLTRQVARIIEGMPLWRLQLVGDREDEFLYRHDRYDGSRIHLEPHVAACFRSFHGFIITLVRSAWIEQILKIRSNRDLLGEQGDLAAFLFGTERSPLNEYRSILRRHQESQCFYCGRRVTGEGVLDHFIPWTRYPVDLGHNFVFADARCNSAKRDHLAATAHLARWKSQNLDCASELEPLFNEFLLRHDAQRSIQIASWAYEQAEIAQSRVWVRQKEFSELDATWRRWLA
jgi:5-methylcytosine-specific restriction endonuclease McrA